MGNKNLDIKIPVLIIAFGIIYSDLGIHYFLDIKAIGINQTGIIIISAGFLYLFVKLLKYALKMRKACKKIKNTHN